MCVWPTLLLVGNCLAIPGKRTGWNAVPVKTGNTATAATKTYSRSNFSSLLIVQPKVKWEQSKPALTASSTASIGVTAKKKLDGLRDKALAQTCLAPILICPGVSWLEKPFPITLAMDMDTEETSPTASSKQRRDVLSHPPNDDFGTVRERRDFGPLEVSLLPILPSPFRDLSFSGLTGWRYHPTAYEEDRLQMGRLLEGNPSIRMVIPDSWNDRIMDHSAAVESTRRQFEKLNSVENTKRRRVNSTESESALLEELKPSALPTAESIPSNAPLPAAAAENLFINDQDMESSNPDTIPSEEATVVTASTTSTNTDPAAGTIMNPAIDLAGSDVIPKQELYFFYGKKPRTVQLKASDYLTWDNGKPVQSVKFTSAFVCPITKEIFLAKSYGDPSSFQKDGGIYWYPKKNLAEHAAAARAVDCWNLRERRHDKKRLSIETPYTVEDAPELPIQQFPISIREKVLQIQREKAALDLSRNTQPVATNLATADTLSDMEVRGLYGGTSTTEYSRDGLETTTRFVEQKGSNSQTLALPSKTEASYELPQDTASNTESRRWQTSRSGDRYRRDGSDNGRFGNSAEAYGRQRNFHGNNHYQNTPFAGRHSYHSYDQSLQGRAHGRGQMDHYNYNYNQSTLQSGRWRQNNQNMTNRRLQDRYGNDSKEEPRTKNQGDDDEW